MEKTKVAAALLLCLTLPLAAQRTELVPFGDFEHWTVRHIRESSIIGGEVRTLYVVGPDETIDGNAPYYSRTIWTSSNAYARMMGVTKTSVTMEPDDGPDGKCARLVTSFATCQVAGLMDIKVLATGALCWGRTLEPITGVKDPWGCMDWGIPFAKRPSALVLDCKAELPSTGILTKGTTFRQKEFPGEDPCHITLLLQNRWEDGDGNIHAERVGTAVAMISRSTGGWVKDKRVPVIHGDATKDPGYGPGMRLRQGADVLYALNSRGVKKPILEEGWAEPGTP